MHAHLLQAPACLNETQTSFGQLSILPNRLAVSSVHGKFDTLGSAFIWWFSWMIEHFERTKRLGFLSSCYLIVFCQWGFKLSRGIVWCRVIPPVHDTRNLSWKWVLKLCTKTSYEVRRHECLIWTWCLLAAIIFLCLFPFYCIVCAGWLFKYTFLMEPNVLVLYFNKTAELFHVCGWG